MTSKVTIERETLKRLIAEAHHSGDSFADTEVIALAEEALAAQPAEPVALDNACMTEQAIDEYLSDYTMEGDSGSHTPDESELLVIKDAIMGLLVYPDFLASFAPPAPAAVPLTKEQRELFDLILHHYGPDKRLQPLRDLIAAAGDKP